MWPKKQFIRQRSQSKGRSQTPRNSTPSKAHDHLLSIVLSQQVEKVIEEKLHLDQVIQFYFLETRHENLSQEEKEEYLANQVRRVYKEQRNSERKVMNMMEKIAQKRGLKLRLDQRWEKYTTLHQPFIVETTIQVTQDEQFFEDFFKRFNKNDLRDQNQNLSELIKQKNQSPNLQEFIRFMKEHIKARIVFHMDKEQTFPDNRPLILQEEGLTHHIYIQFIENERFIPHRIICIRREMYAMLADMYGLTQQEKKGQEQQNIHIKNIWETIQDLKKKEKQKEEQESKEKEELVQEQRRKKDQLEEEPQIVTQKQHQAVTEEDIEWINKELENRKQNEYGEQKRQIQVNEDDDVEEQDEKNRTSSRSKTIQKQRRTQNSSKEKPKQRKENNEWQEWKEWKEEKPAYEHMMDEEIQRLVVTIKPTVELTAETEQNWRKTLIVIPQTRDATMTKMTLGCLEPKYNYYQPVLKTMVREGMTIYEENTQFFEEQFKKWTQIKGFGNFQYVDQGKLVNIASPFIWWYREEHQWIGLSIQWQDRNQQIH